MLIEHILNSLSGPRMYITGHPVQAVLIMGLIFAVSSVVGETILYWMARLGGRPLVFRFSRWLRLDERKINKVETMFARWGTRAGTRGGAESPRAASRPYAESTVKVLIELLQRPLPRMPGGNPLPSPAR